MDQFWTYNLLLTILQYKATAVIIAIAIIVDFVITYMMKAEQFFSAKEKFLHAAATALIKFISFVAVIVLIAIGLEILTYFFVWISSGSKW